MKTKNFLNESLNMKNAITPDNGSTLARQRLDNGSTKLHKNLSRVVALLCLLLTIGVGNAWGDYYTITFNGSNSESTALSGAAADITGSSSYVTGNISSVTKSYGPTSDGVKVGASSNAGSFTISLSAAGQVTPTSIVVNCKLYNSSKSATVNVNGIGAQSVPSDFGDVSFTTSTALTSLTIASSKYIWVKSVTVNYTSGGGSTPTITKSSSMTTFGYDLSSGVANKQSFTVAGTNLSEALTVTPPAGYEISTSENGTYQTTALSFTPSTGTVSTQTIWVRLKAIADLTAGTKEGNIVCASTGATTQNVAVSGSVPFTVTWKANGETHATTYVAYATAPGTALGSLPSDPETSCGGKVLYGWYEGDYSDASIAPSVVSTSTKITADKTYNAVYANRSGSSKTYEFDITPSQFNTTSYAANNNQKSSTATATDASGATMTVKWTSNQIMKSSSNMQWQKNTSYIYNDTDLGTVNSVTITKTAGGYNTTYGTTSHPTSGAQGSGNGYFTVKENNTATGTVSLVRVNYTVSSYVYSDYSTTCGTCSENPTVGVAALKGSFSLTSVGVTCPTTGTGVGTNCSWTDYGFVWSESVANPTLVEATGNASTNCTKVQVGTSGTVSTWDGNLTKSSFELGHTYKYRAYGKNGYASGSYQYGTVATFTPRSVTFNLNSHGTSAPSTQYINNGGKVSNPSYSESVSGWRFDGWYGNAACTGNAWSFADSIVSGANRTLYAKWTQVYTVTYAYAGGSSSCSDDTKYAAGATVTVCATPPTKSGSTFLGWLGDNSIGTKAANSTFTMPAANVTLTAQWEDTEYTLTQTKGSHTTSSVSATKIKSGDLSPSGKDFVYTISNIAANKGYALPKNPMLTGGGQTWTRNTNYTWTLSDDRHSATLHIAADLTISADLTINVSEVARYLVEWDEHGSIDSVYYAADDNSVTLKTGIADCGTKKFYCWTENSEFVSHASTPPTAASSGTISANKHYYAIYGDRSGGVGFEKVTSVTDGATYYIATGLTSSDQGYGGQNGSNSYGTNISLSGATFNGSNVLTAFSSSVKAVTVAISNGYFSMYDGTSYLTLTSDANNINYSNSAAYVWELTASNYYIKPKDYTRWMMFNSNRFACYSNATDKSYAYLYKSAVSWTNFAKACTLYDITIDNEITGGSIAAKNQSGTTITQAGSGNTVTVSVTPNSCKYLSALSYNDGSDHDILSTKSFTMPSSDVTITATFSTKTVSSIAATTSTHRVLMQGSSFAGEQITVTYNDGSTEVLDWDDATLTFTGYNMSTTDDYTVNVAYDGACGEAECEYDIEVVDGVPITFSDCGVTTTIKYEPDDPVAVDSRNGAYACSGWEFVGWSATSVAANSTSFTPVRNFSASSARTLYAVYAHIRKDGSSVVEYESADMVADLKEGARYVVAYFTNSNDGISSGLTGMLPTVASTNYLSGTSSFAGTEDKNASNSYVYHSTATIAANAHWQLMSDGTGYWQLYNKSENKYLDLSGHTNGYIGVSTSPVGKIVIGNYTESVGDNDSRLEIKYNGCSDPHYVSWKRGDYFNQYSSGKVFMLTKDEYFSSNPPCAPRSVTFHGNGGIVTNYEETESDYDLVVTEASRDAGITTPTADMDASDCAGNDWTFMGWLDEEVDVSRVPILTTDLLNDGGGGKSHTITADDEEYWAVYSNTGPAETKYGTISFTKADFNSSYSSTENTTTKTVTSMGDYVFGYKNVGHSSEIGIQFQEDNGELYNKTSLGKVNSISFTTFSAGGINKLNVYVGDEEKTTDHLLTAEEMQNVGSTWTYYPTENESYVYITNVGKGNGSYVCVDGISIDFGRGTTIYATTPVCSTIRLSGDVYVTSRNGVGIMAVTPLSVEAHQLAANADVVITSNSSDVYFSKDRNANFAKAEANKPKTSVTVTANGSGELSATPIYVHYKPSIDGSGAATNVTVYANLSPADPNTKGEKAIHVRNLPNKVVIAAKVGGAYYALPANLNGATNPAAVLIDVDESNMTAIGPASCAYTIWPVKTTSGSGDRYALQGGNAYGERVRFSATNNSNKGLWANNASSDPKTRIDNDAAITAIGSDPAAAYEWKITTTVTDGKWSHTLQTDQSNNTKYLRYWTAASGGPKWGTYASGEQNIYLLPVTEVVQTEAYFVEWGQHGGVVEVDASGVSAAKVKAKLNGVESALQALSQTLTSVKERASVYNYTVNFGNDIDFSAAASAGAALTLKWYNSSDVLVATSNIIVPRIIAESATMSSIESRKTYWTTENGPTNEVHVLPGVTLTADAGSFANSDVTIKQLEIYQGATVKVTTGTLDVDTLVLRNGWSRAGSKRYDVARLYIATTANLTTEVNHTYADWYIDYDQYYPIAVPWDVTLANIRYRYCSVSPTIGDNQNIRLRYYDGASRASGGSGTNWKDYGKSGNTDMPTKIVPSQGYAITAKRPAGKAFSILRMPLTIPANTWTALGEQGEVTVSSVTTHKNQVSVEAYGDDKTPWYAKGWNFIANPYMSVFNGNDNGVTGKLMNQQGTSIKYATIPDTDFKDYYQVNMAEANLKPASGFLVQVGTTGTLTFSNGKIVAPSAPARISNESTAIPEQEAYIRLSNDAGYDQMGLIIGDDYTAEYEMNADLSKMLGETNALKTWLRYTNMDMAYVAINEQLAREWIPVTVNIPAEGEYTYTLLNSSTVDELEGVYLIDYQTGVTTNLIFDDYVFTAEAGTFDNRFAINAIVGKRDTPTGADITCGDEDGVKAIKFVYHDKVFILHRGVIYDSTGKRVNVINK